MEYVKNIKEQRDQSLSKVSFEQWLAHILSLFPPPAVLMIEIDEEGKFKLLAASSNVEALNLVLNERQARYNYIG